MDRAEGGSTREEVVGSSKAPYARVFTARAAFRRIPKTILCVAVLFAALLLAGGIQLALVEGEAALDQAQASHTTAARLLSERMRGAPPGGLGNRGARRSGGLVQDCLFPCLLTNAAAAERLQEERASADGPPTP